ncbi:MAG: hypothetical protein HC936_01195 [Leptolyngbyaceae cyanobacterium SU_3_3]|nr:hypothetical protein [Leptolyngbyaceae cyanobacterium SU_3_3]
MAEMTMDGMTEEQWQIAHAIAQTLVKQETDANELGKAIAYFRFAMQQEPASAGTRFFKYLKTLVNNGRSIGHSGRTPDYYRSIDKACNTYLHEYQTKPVTLLQILGWAMRLMRYYKEGGAIAETPAPIDISRQPSQRSEIAKPKPAQTFQIDQRLEARVDRINRNKVTYKLLDGLRLTEKEPKKASELQEGQTVKVRIAALKEDGSINHVKFVE